MNEKIEQEYYMVKPIKRKACNLPNGFPRIMACRKMRCFCAVTPMYLITVFVSYRAL